MTKDHHHDHTPGLKQRSGRPIHHSPIFWAGFALILVAILFYVVSDDLAWRPQIH